MSTSSPHWHTLFCDWIYHSDIICAKYRSWGTPDSSCQLTDDVASLLHFIAHIFYVFCAPAIDRELRRRTSVQSRVQALLLLVSLSVLWRPVCCPGEFKSPLSSLRLGTDSGSQSYSFRCPISRDSVLSICEKVFDRVARVQSSAYSNFSDSVGGRSLMYTLKNDGASTDPWGRPFFNIRFRLTWLPRNTIMFRWLIRLAMSLIVVRHLMGFDNSIMSPAG